MSTDTSMKTIARLKRWRACRVTLRRSLGLAVFLAMTAVVRLSVPSDRTR